MSPSARKVWIEIIASWMKYKGNGSPSARKVWIEIVGTGDRQYVGGVTFREEGVD